MLLTLLALLAQTPASPPPDAGWLGVQAGMVEVALAHDHGGGRLDGGVLKVDPNRRVVLWEGIPGPVGCPDRVEATFDDVKNVENADFAGLRIRFRKPINKMLVLIPRPHAQWLRARPGVVDSQAATTAANAAAQGPGESGGIAMIGDMASAGPTLQRLDLPRNVVADTRTAMDSIREALGRTVTPGAALREAMHGAARDVELVELLSTPADHAGQAVRTVGVVVRPPAADGTTELIAGGRALRVEPAAEVTKLWTALARTWVAREIEVTGLLAHGSREGGAPVLTLSVWEFSPTDRSASADGARATGLADLVEGKSKDGDLVRVVGLFRGQNLFGDVEGGAPSGQAWVLKSGAHAVWVVGKPAAGSTWKLDPAAQEDATYWLEVVGRVSSQKGRTRIHARSVALTAPPPEAHVAATAPQARLVTGVAGAPPVVVFALPLDGDTGVPISTRFVLQFSKYMDAASFQGRVRVRYVAADGQPGRELPNVKLAYDDSRRALVVDPGEVFDPGAQVECVLLAGIADLQGLPLAPRPGRSVTGAVDVLRFRVAQ